MNFIKLAGLIPLLYVTSVVAMEPFVVKDIRVDGIQRTESRNGVQLFTGQGG